MDRFFDGNGLSREQLQAKAEAAAHAQLDGGSSQEPQSPVAPKRTGDCDWQGDPPEPELDDLAHPPKESQKPFQPVGACDWRGDEPEQHKDDLRELCQPSDKARQADHRTGTVKDHESVQMPTPRSSKVAAIPEIRSYWHRGFLEVIIVDWKVVEPPSDEESPDRKPGSQADIGTSSRESRGFRSGKRHADPKAANEKTTEDRVHSPWVDSLEQLPATRMEKVNRGVKETLEAAASILMPSAHDEPQAREPAATEKSRRGSALAPDSAAPPTDLYVPGSAQRVDEASTDAGETTKQRRERVRSEKKAQRDARRRARREKKKARRDARREAKEVRRKEREWKKIVKKGGELQLPLFLREGVPRTLDAKVSYNPKCDICTKAAASAMSSKARDPKCTLCAKAAEHESTDQYLKSLKINLAELPSLDELSSILRRFLEEERSTEGGGVEASSQTHSEQELLEHVTLHIRDFATNGGETHLCGQKCDKKGQPGHLARHGLDGVRDSPLTISRGSHTPVTTSPPVEWWMKALAANKEPSSLYSSASPPRASTPLRRSKTTVYEPRATHFSVPRRHEVNSAAYHFYLPLAVCHGPCCSQSQSDGPETKRGHSFSRARPPLSPGAYFNPVTTDGTVLDPGLGLSSLALPVQKSGTVPLYLGLVM
ncbi:hypothetical protein F4808DRAFT_456528 [Astrocystis sublimbata]|nr:hypothetical protein F4808DRAFT_456528 [Astrocystis sublimbata]